MTPIVMIAGFKGGSGKTTIAHHLAARADERGLRVLVIDADPQGDAYRRIVGDGADLDDAPPTAWGGASRIVHSPGGYALPAKAAEFDIVIVDTPPVASPPQGPPPALVIVPIDGPDAARNAAETLAWAREVAVLAVPLLNGTSEGGKRHDRLFARIREQMPAGVALAPLEVPRSGAIKRSAATCRPAWSDLWPDRGADTLRAVCDAVIDAVTQTAVARPARRAGGRRG